MTVAPIAQPRHAYLRVAFLGLLGLLLASSIPLFLTFAWPGTAPPPARAIRVPAGLVPEAGSDPLRFDEGRFWLVHLLPGEDIPDQIRASALEPLPNPNGPGGLLAIYWRSPFLGCTIPWRPTFSYGGVLGWFRDPCHGGTYSKAGLQVFGPPTRSMDTLRLQVQSDGSVLVFVDEIIPGDLDNPLRAVRYEAER